MMMQEKEYFEALIPSAGEYRVWVRTKDWVPEYHPGGFQVLIDGEPIPMTFGVSGNDWSWELAEHVPFPAGDVRIALHDLTGFDGRCDALYITNTANVPPFRADEAMRLWRKRLLGLPAAREKTERFDVVVVGAGMAGLCAAYTAAREGLRTALIGDRPYLGGNASKEIGLTPEAELGPVVTMLAERKENGDICAADIFRKIPNLSVCLNERVFRVNTNEDGKKIYSVDAQHTGTGEERRFGAPMFIDCSGKATLALLCGASTMEGQEAYPDFHEKLAPEKADIMHHGNTVLFRTEMAEKPVAFPEVPWAQAVAKDHADLEGQLASCHDTPEVAFLGV